MDDTSCRNSFTRAAKELAQLVLQSTEISFSAEMIGLLIDQPGDRKLINNDFNNRLIV